ncbi:helical backbone metal receptor [Paraburkholderia sabiae]|uniref:Helical backbone metal receptor n=1 Tax=Paraburkholderia sabiae TaxID=273251 RepID=A0ABU9QDK3_9BURK|nr:helical backbone metal receptor [Paraburkholderia sabiae]WJZ74454.1 helical backbone metal receptor [Paraburkholderia sabiae]CAD6545381.1 Vitamin B12-binding protein [Paraburkholderia sabiae]
MATRVVDAAGIEHATAEPGARIVSLVPSLTELLFALKLDAQIVGRTGFCVHPRDKVRNVPKVGGTKAVKIDAVRALQPTHVIVNIDENERDTVEQMRAFVPHVVVTHPLEPRDNLALYALLGALFDRGQEARELSAALERQLNACTSREWPTQNVLYAIWREPWMTVARDTYISAMLRLVNWHTLPDVHGGEKGAARYPSFDLDAAWLAQADRVLLSSEPYRFTQQHCDALSQDARLKNKRVELIDGEMVSWYGSRAIDGIAYLVDYASRRQA